jgi:glycerate kinase
MKIVIAPDSFKESLSAQQVAECIEKGFKTVFPNAQYFYLPLADGGEGTVDVLLQGLNGTKKTSIVTDPIGKPTSAQWALLDNGKTALIEIAAASGLDLIIHGNRNPALTTSFGTGELILEAMNMGVQKILLGLGGSATNDGGAGIFQALGGKLLNKEGQELPFGAIALQDLHSIDNSQLSPKCKDVELIVACDVNNPLCGLQGASHIFGPQKGATKEMVFELDNAIKHFDSSASLLTGGLHYHTPGFGAAGGASLGLSLAFNIQIKSGIEMVLDILSADEVIKNADLVITGEGQMDNQTLLGKAPYGIAKRAQASGIPVIGIAGSTGIEVDNLYQYINAVFGSVRSPQRLEQVLSEAESNLINISRNIAMTLKIGQTLNTVKS